MTVASVLRLKRLQEYSFIPFNFLQKIQASSGILELFFNAAVGAFLDFPHYKN